MPGLDNTDPMWPYLLGQQFVAAVTACGFECDRIFVSPRVSPEAPAPGCECQVAVVVIPGYQGPSADEPAGCLPTPLARVRVVLDLCLAEAPDSAVLTVVQLNTDASKVLQAQWRILAGLQKARFHGQLGDGCGRVLPGSWEQISQDGANGRWQTEWRVLL